MTLILVTVSVTAWSQQGAPLSLDSALGLAEKQNLTLLAARLRRAISVADVQIARQRPNPTFSFTALRDEPHEGWFIDQPLEIGGKRGHRIDVANEQGKLTDVEITALTRQIRRQTRDAYYQLAFARAESARRKHVLELAQRLEQIAKERFETGAVAQIEVVQAGLEVARADADFQVAQQQEKVALSDLNALLNEPATTSWHLAQSLSALPPQVTLSNLIQLAYSSNPDLQHVAQEQKVEESRRGLLKAERIPDLTVEFGLDYNAPHDFRVGPRGQVSMALPLFSRNQGEIAQSLANQRVLDTQEEATKRSVAAQVEAAYYQLDAQRTQSEIYRQTLLPVAQRLESMAEDSYRSGKSDILVVLAAQRNVRDVERSYLESLFTVQSDFSALEELVGSPLDQR